MRHRPDLRAQIDELFEAHIKSDPEVSNSGEKLDYYFNSYSHYGIHEEMLQDNVRTKAYQLSMIRNKELFKDKIVLDVGCGTGVLSIFAVRAGAKHVYAIEKANIYHKAKEIVELNGLSSKITVLNGKIEELELPVQTVDIIISEWMGYALLYEGMFDSVIFARDKWLAKGGMLFPDKAVMHVRGIDDLNYWREKKDFWNSVGPADPGIRLQLPDLQEVGRAGAARRGLPQRHPLHRRVLRLQRRPHEVHRERPRLRQQVHPDRPARHLPQRHRHVVRHSLHFRAAHDQADH